MQANDYLQFNGKKLLKKRCGLDKINYKTSLPLRRGYELYQKNNFLNAYAFVTDIDGIVYEGERFDNVHLP